MENKTTRPAKRAVSKQLKHIQTLEQAREEVKKAREEAYKRAVKITALEKKLKNLEVQNGIFSMNGEKLRIVRNERFKTYYSLRQCRKLAVKFANYINPPQSEKVLSERFTEMIEFIAQYGEA